MSWRSKGSNAIEHAELSIVNVAQIERIGPGQVFIDELAGDGAGTITFQTADWSLKVLPFENNHPIRWYFENKCADGAILLAKDGEVELHVVELKSYLSQGKWHSARRQLAGMLHNALAVAGSLSLLEPSRVVCYVAYQDENVSDFVKSSPASLKRMVGTGVSAMGTNGSSLYDFSKRQISLADGEAVSVQFIVRDKFGNATVRLS